MKKTFSIFGVLILISSVVFAGGIDDPSSTKVVVSQNGTVVKVFYKSENKNVKISIADANGTTLFSETVQNKNGFIRPYNLSNLAEGEYTVTVEDENGVNKKKVAIEKAKPELLSAIVKLKEEKKCAILLAGKHDANAIITIKDDSQKVVFSESVYADGNSVKLLDLSSYKGPVTVEVKGNNGLSISKSVE